MISAMFGWVILKISIMARSISTSQNCGKANGSGESQDHIGTRGREKSSWRMCQGDIFALRAQKRHTSCALWPCTGRLVWTLRMQGRQDGAQRLFSDDFAPFRRVDSSLSFASEGRDRVTVSRGGER